MGLSKSIIFFSAYFMFNALPNPQLTCAQGLLGIKSSKDVRLLILAPSTLDICWPVLFRHSIRIILFKVAFYIIYFPDVYIQLLFNLNIKAEDIENSKKT